MAKISNAELYDNESLIAVKSNSLIGAKYKSTLLENKIITYALANVHDIVDDTAGGGYRFTFSSAELLHILGMSSRSGSFYSRLKEASLAMTGHVIGFEDEKSQTFEYISLIHHAKYENGKFSIWFNKAISKEYIFDLKANFTKLPLLTMMNFKSVYSFRLYELLKAQSYPRKGQIDKTQFRIQFGISELKLELGIVNAELESVKRVLMGNVHPTDEDYDRAVEKSPEKMFSDWSSFRRSVIDVAVKEINTTPSTMMRIDYDTQRAGRGGKVSKIIFHVEIIEQSNEILPKNKSSVSEDEKDDVVERLLDALSEIGFRFKIKTCRMLAEKANWDEHLLFKVVQILNASKDTIEDPTGFMISAIENDWFASRNQVNKMKERGIIKFRNREDIESPYFVDATGQLEIETGYHNFEVPNE